MALHPKDRRELAQAGLALLVYGLALSPVMHAVVGHEVMGADPTFVQGWATHGRSGMPLGRGTQRSHSHGGERKHSHPDSSVEHLGASSEPARWDDLTPAPPGPQVESGLREERGASRPAFRSPEMPQGP